MAATAIQPVAIDVAESVDRVIDDRVLVPIPGEKPSGEDPRHLDVWSHLRTARPKAEDGMSDNRWQKANAVDTDWETYRELVEKALCNQSKDLELGVFLTEASTRVFGFAGVRDGLWMLGGLISGFIGRGLYPRPEDGDVEIQYGKLTWLNDKFVDVIREIPLTQSADAETNYSLNYRDESRRQGGMITAAQYEAVASAGSTEAYSDLLTLIKQSRAELDTFRKIATEHYGDGAFSVGVLQETIDECFVAIQTILQKREGARVDLPVATTLPLYMGPSTSTGFATTAAPTSDAWSECERLARSGNIDSALTTMATLAAAEPNGRIRFQRKLLLADLCLKTNRKKLGTSILQELNEIIDQHKLELWETSEIVGGVWARLVRCYRDKAAGTADEGREAEFYRKLSRLDPWQALACGEPAKKD